MLTFSSNCVPLIRFTNYTRRRHLSGAEFPIEETEADQFLGDAQRQGQGQPSQPSQQQSQSQTHHHTTSQSQSQSSSHHQSPPSHQPSPSPSPSYEPCQVPSHFSNRSNNDNAKVNTGSSSGHQMDSRAIHNNTVRWVSRQNTPAAVAGGNNSTTTTTRKSDSSNDEQSPTQKQKIRNFAFKSVRYEDEEHVYVAAACEATADPKNNHQQPSITVTSHMDSATTTSTTSLPQPYNPPSNTMALQTHSNNNQSLNNVTVTTTNVNEDFTDRRGAGCWGSSSPLLINIPHASAAASAGGGGCGGSCNLLSRRRSQFTGSSGGHQAPPSIPSSTTSSYVPSTMPESSARFTAADVDAIPQVGTSFYFIYFF